MMKPEWFTRKSTIETTVSKHAMGSFGPHSGMMPPIQRVEGMIRKNNMEEEEILGGWERRLPAETTAKGFALAARAAGERTRGTEIYPFPDRGHIFRALFATPPEKVKAVILGQDPYHEPGQACGLAFSVEPGSPLPRSLRNIFRELCADTGCAMPESGDLTPWAERGVLLLNTVLTVERGRANSHTRWGWQGFTREVLHATFRLPQPVVYMLWGRPAQAFCTDAVLNPATKRVLQSNHPSPLSAARGPVPFFGSRPFTRANRALEEMGTEKIDWRL